MCIRDRLYRCVAKKSSEVKYKGLSDYRRSGLKNTHHWCRRTDTATENGVEQAESRRHCGSHPPAASSIVPDQWCMFCTPSCNIFHALLTTGFKCCEFGHHSWVGINCGVSLSNNAIIARALWAFQVSQGSVVTLFMWDGKRLITLRQIYSGNYVSIFITIARVL